MTLKELLSVTYSDVTVMDDNIHPMLILDSPYENYGLLSTELTESIVRKIRCADGCIKVWVKGENEDDNTCSDRNS